MEQSTYGTDAIPKTIQSLSEAIAGQLKLLLETKHLYQSVKVDGERIIADIEARTVPQARKQYQDWVAGTLPTTLFTPGEQYQNFVRPGQAFSATPILFVQNVKLFCSKCDSREAFRPIFYLDVTSELQRLRLQDSRIEPAPHGVQLFALVYQCQICKGTPTAFLIRRSVWQFALDGRSPMEHVEVPAFIPKPERQFFRDAIIAINAGKTLAAVFYLRTFIEQFARRQTGTTGRATGEEILEAYGATLPPTQRDQMPSLRQCYEQLSEALHNASEDSDVFEKAKAAVERHFDIRRVFKIPDAKIPDTGGAGSDSTPSKPDPGAS